MIFFKEKKDPVFLRTSHRKKAFSSSVVFGEEKAYFHP
jgi:hypothetical protein